MIPTLESMPSTFVDRNPERASVPCGSCTLCCKTLIVPLAEEEFMQYDWVWVVRKDTQEKLGRALKRLPNGDCVYLGEKGCTIWGRAPHTCQRFDCRDLITKMNRINRRAAIKSGKLPKELFDKAKEMLNERS